MRKTRGSYSNPGKMDCTIKDLTVPDNLCIVAQKKAWMNERLMMGWLNGVLWKNMTEISAQMNKRNRFSQVLNGGGCV